MSKLDDAVLQGFISSILNTESYREYRTQLELIEQDPVLKAQVDEFRKRNFEMQTSDGLDLGRLQSFENEFKNLRENPIVDAFLAAELDFIRMMQDIYLEINQAIDFK